MRRILFFVALAVVLVAKADLQNLALNKPYTLSAKPNYSHCTDDGDVSQLTDGTYSQGYFWVQKSTVGWRGVLPVVVTIDLGQREPICGVSWSTAAGVAGVSWPQSLQVFVSDDKRVWSYLGDLCDLGVVATNPPTQGYAQFRYATDKMRDCGRYVSIVAGSRPYCFVDEIEVWRGDAQWLAEAQDKREVKDPRAYYFQNCLRSGVVGRLRADMGTIRARATTSDDAALRATIEAGLHEIESSIELFLDQLPESQQSILPYGGLHEKILALNALALKKAGVERPLVWRSDRWAPLGMLDIPAQDSACREIPLDLMRGEVRGEVFNITQPQAEALEVTLELRDTPRTLNIELCEVLFTDAVGHTPVAAALKPLAPEVDGRMRLRVPGGTTKQVWVSCRRPTAAPGEYKGAIRLTAQSVGFAQELLLHTRIRNLQFPARPTLHVGGWDYVQGAANYYKAPGNLDSNMALMRDMYVDTPWATPAVFPKGAQFDEAGRLQNAEALDFTLWDEWVARWHGARNYCVFFSVGGKFNGEPMGTPRFNVMVGEWLGAWVRHLGAQGIKPQQFVILLLDEPHESAQDEIIIKWAQAVKAADTGVTLFEDPTWQNPAKANPAMFALCDVLCPNTPMMLGQGGSFEDFYVKQRAAGKTLWLYSCSGPAKQLDPVSYHRAQAWRAFKLGAQGTLFWAFGCGGGIGDSWRVHTQPGVEYSPYFVGQESVMEGKHSQAIRESVQDYEYLTMLRAKVDQQRATGGSANWLAEAEKLLGADLAEALQSVVAGNLHWSVDKDRTLFDKLRIRALDLLEESGRE